MRRGAPALAVVALLAAGGCRTLFEGGTERFAVKPGVAFSMLRDAPYLPIIDLRTAEEFHGPLGHMAGARSIPLGELEEHRTELRAYRGSTVLAYCRATDCGREAFERLSSYGIDDPVFLDGGLEAWIADGFGTVHRASADDPSAERPEYEP